MTGFKNFEFVAGLVLIVLIGGAVALSGLLFPDGGRAMDLTARLTAPFTGWNHPLGTDPLGRDILARVVVGGRVSFFVGIVSALGAVVIGTVVGLLAGYYRGPWDMFLMRFADIQLALPFILLAMTVIAIIGPGLDRIIVLMIVAQWVQYARLIRGSVLSLRQAEFVQAAQSYGLPDRKILFGHILPNAMGPLVILATLNVANNILLESSLTFLGLGIDPLVPSWGGMLADGRNYIQTAPWVTIFPGLAIMLTVLGLNLLGDWLRDRLDPLGATK
ncbi:MAG: ABC transporter permease [Limimaricola soesokkakensis]|uniref:Glutathione transport system permease protein GsiD n=1 Tax=Limimaricola soesokkakensis TaxID=1343159 RepID=A0A1X6ZP19_9RHOB|nr:MULTISPECIES: ABC transporter permease [Limimaricola]PSK85792.1 peptide/nickel transport system permease protein [Limimaricola soesokkakensis]WPY93268.1 ABC transporter permease [Limimaricola variabilis]SLN57050.1 Glutathione transport system permease protein GsiD [Limimaricola soesokkakensis]